MGFWDDLGKGLTYAFPVVAAANGIGDIGDKFWGGYGPGNAATGGAFQGGGIIPGFGSGDKAPTAAQLTPEQQASIAGGYINPSAQAPVTGIEATTTYQPGPFGTQVPVISHTPVYGESLRDQAMAGFNAGAREAPQLNGARMMGTQIAAPSQMDQPANITGATINPNATARGDQTAAAGLNMTAGAVRDAGQTRGVQQSQTDRLTSAADGAAPSVAENQLRAGLAQGMQSNLALAASNRGSGSSAVLAQRQAQDANASMAARTNAQAATLRAGEMAQARGELTGHLGQVRGQDLATGQLGTQTAGIGVQQAGIGANLATAQAGLTQGANLANQQTQLATGQANLGAAQQTQIANLNAAQQTSMANLTANQQTQLANAQLVMQQQGMDDQQKMAYLATVMGIDARTQQGQMALQQLLVDAKLRTDATNAGIGSVNATNATNQQLGMLSGVATLGSALI